MEPWTSILIGISTSFIASIFFFFFSGFIKRKSNHFLDWVASKNKSYSKKIYTNLSQGKSIFVEVFPAFALLFIIFTSLTITSINLDSSYEVQLQVIEELKKNPKIDYEILYQLEEEYQKKQVFRNHSFVRNNIWIYTMLKYFLFGFTFISTLYISVSILRWSRTKESNKDFRRSLEIITPFVEQEKINSLKSKWGMMTSKEDYDEIYKEIKDYLKKIKENKNKPIINNL